MGLDVHMINMESDPGENRRIVHGLPCLDIEEVFMSILERLLEDEISRAASDYI